MSRPKDFGEIFTRKSCSNLYVNLSIVFSLICIVFFSFNELSKLGTDFGKYYTSARFLGDNYQIFNEIFTHKGPTYFYFLKNLGDFIGWGLLNSIFSLIISLLVFFIPIYSIVLKYIKSNEVKILLILMATTLLIGQGSNSSIGFFKEGLMIISLSRLFLSRFNIPNFSISLTFFWLAFFTRIDAILFLPLITLYLIFFYFREKSITKKFLITVLYLIIPLIIFSLFSSYFNFSFNDYLIHNFKFNFWYSSFDVNDSIATQIKGLVYRPKAFLISSYSLIIPFILFFLISDIRNNGNLNKIYLVEKVKKISFGWLIIITCSFGYLLTYSDKNYFALIFLSPALFFVINKFVKNDYYSKLVSIPILLFLLSFNTYYLSFNIKGVATELPHIPPYQKTIDYVKNNKITEIEIVGGRGWPYLLADAKPLRAITDWWFYEPSKPFITQGLLKQHKTLISRPSGYIFWIDNTLLTNKNSKNIFLNELLSKSIKIEDQDYYSMLKIK